jgi:tRNA threonylcarbamoyladenosine biosynthesis protein TsaE
VAQVEVVTASASDTEDVAAAIAGGLRPGDVVLLIGEVGTGKTTFVRGASRALGVAEHVTSPSFTIGHRYRGDAPVSHLDLFRLDTLDGEDPGLLADYLDDESIAFVEWPRDMRTAVALGVSPERESLVVRMFHLGQDRRRLELAGRDDLVRRVPA